MSDMVPGVYWIAAILAKALALAVVFSGLARVQEWPASRHRTVTLACLVLLSGFLLAMTAFTALTRFDLFYGGLLATLAVLVVWAVCRVISVRIERRGNGAG